ncbi:hypothetical protein chiPu_0006098 [Chiloscyllium punctatum]|uniref:Uncharacterized protein n=1 Tax=Chiloscyllium punctatum TaxID=137246 RepID=A0A401SBA0_CHIPU|nr:hypothetical protein [Chiloscyllium punctatum]
MIDGHTRSVESLCFSHDSRLLASGSWDCTVILWDSKATGSWDYTVRVWKIRKTRRKLVLYGHKGNVSCVTFSAIGMLASGSWDKTICVWDCEDGKCKKILKVINLQVFIEFI